MQSNAPIVIVDDSPQDREFAQHTLRRLPLTVPLVFLTCGADLKAYVDGLAAYGNRAIYPYPGVVLLDLEMPNGDGFETLEWLKAQTAHAALPIIALSGSKSLAHVNRAYGLGARSFLTKPIDLKDFQSMIKVLKLSI
ncbi:MAG TPA: response regulator [Verrucomicrobiae bacterium]|nr:response regulator [Verrucomicrobiae bacterium]